ncbi:hypothetical protein GGR56DRAFT_531998 [Xylariaceae sp. FL0804]|nr:hypothetical protein GGR56DRAFT_531998 [Xylariaceae sp. FL0804]
MESSEGRDRMFASPWMPTPRQIACRRCRLRKKKCDKRRPVCGECSKSGTDCQVLLPKKQNHGRDANARRAHQFRMQPPIADRRSSYIYALEEHVASLESRLRRSHPGIAIDHMSPARRRSLRPPQSDPADDGGESDGTPPQLAGHVCEDDAAMEDNGANSDEWMMDAMNATLFPPHVGELADAEDAPVDGDIPVDPLLLPPFTENMDATDQERTTHGSLVLADRPSMPSSALSARHLTIAVGSRYATEYFANAHPMWPFLHQRQWDDCWRRWESPVDLGGTRATWMHFFSDMVLSIGSLLAQNSDPAPEHLEAFKHLKDRALETYNSYGTAGWSPVVKTQSLLLLTVQAMHLDSVSTLRDRASDAIRQCTTANLQGQSNRPAFHPLREIEAEIRRQATRCCFTIDILISTSTNQGVSFTERLLDEETLDDDAAGEGSSHGSSQRTLNHEDHMFQLRRIQNRTLKMVQKLEARAARDRHPVPNLWRSRVRHELDRWSDDVAALSAGSEEPQDRFRSQMWLLKLANYARISLYPNPHLAVRSGDAKHLVSAACQVLVAFRRFRIKDHLTCHTWTALVHQFQAGVVLLYCVWATPTHLQRALYDGRAVCQALFACSATLVDFYAAHRWGASFGNATHPARVLRNVFDLLTREVPVSEFGDPTQQWALSPEAGKELRQLAAELEAPRLQLQGRVVALLREMAAGGRVTHAGAPSEEETRWIQYTYPDWDEDDDIAR